MQIACRQGRKKREKLGRANSWWVGWLDFSVLLGSFFLINLRPGLGHCSSLWLVLLTLRPSPQHTALEGNWFSSCWPMGWFCHCTRWPGIMEIWQACLAETEQMGFSPFFLSYSGEREAQRRRKLRVQNLPSRRELLWKSLCRENNPVGVSFSVVWLLAWQFKLYCLPDLLGLGFHSCIMHT